MKKENWPVPGKEGLTIGAVTGIYLIPFVMLFIWPFPGALVGAIWIALFALTKAMLYVAGIAPSFFLVLFISYSAMPIALACFCYFQFKKGPA